MKNIENKEKKQQILHRVDHTILGQTATWAQVQAICDDAIACGTASACIPPSYVKRAKEYVGDRLAICTVIGFPNGYMTTAAKAFETEDALANGADEIDMVINLGDLKDGRTDLVKAEIETVKKLCGDKILKVIVETCLLTEEEKKTMCRIVTEAGADYIKTSTGFSTGGATVEDIRLFAANIGAGVRIKAAGGIGSFEQAEALVEAGADRLGSSRLVRQWKEELDGE